MSYIIEWDLQLLHMLHEFASPGLDLFFKFITDFADFEFMTVLLIVLLLYQHTRKIGVQILIAELLQLALGGYLLKRLIARPRPFLVDPSLELIVKSPTSFSCPSGHASTAFALAFVLVYSDCPRFWKQLTLAFAVMIGLSRLYLQVHFPTDVLLGMALGCACGYASKIICVKMQK